jgi:hypothetical protein
MKIVSFWHSKLLYGILIGISGMIILLTVFALGRMTGYRKAEFSYRWGENYHKNFAGPRGGFLEGMMDRGYIEGHGVFGIILRRDGDQVVVRGRDDVEKIIILKSATVIRRFGDSVKQEELKENDRIVVIGIPNDQGQIEAQYIRIMPSPSR